MGRGSLVLCSNLCLRMLFRLHVCWPGYYCPTGSTSPTTASCQPGTYSVAGAAVCSNCSAGRFGQTVALDTPVCSGDCPAGRYCTEGSIVPVRLPFMPKGMRAAVNCSITEEEPELALCCVTCACRRFALRGSGRASSDSHQYAAWTVLRGTSVPRARSTPH